MTIRSVWHINNNQTREDTRFAPIGIMTPNSNSPLVTANGVIPSGTSMNLTSTGAMTAQVEIGRAVVQGLVTQGCYPVVITAPETLTFADGDASNPRIDSVMIVIRDDPYDSSGFTDVRCMVVQGTPAASPAHPALPFSASLRLFDVRVEQGASAGSGGISWSTAVTDTRTWAVPLGGIGLGANPGAYAGQWRDSGGAAGTLSRYNGTAWESFVRLDTGGQVVIGDTNLRRDGASALATDNIFRVYRPNATDNAVSLRVASDTASRFFMNADGNMNWGVGGSTSTDTKFYRAAAGQLKTDTDLVVGGNLNVGATTFTTYTPTVTNGGTATWTTRTGYSFKLGKLVFVSCYLVVNAAGSGSGVVTVTMPSNVDRSTRQTLVMHAETVGVNGNGASTGGTIRNGQCVFFSGGSGNASDRLRVTDSDGDGDQNILGVDLKAGAIINIEGWYREA